MQSTSFSGLTADKVLDATALGWDPADYTHWYIQVLGTESVTFSVEVQAPGSSQFAVINGLDSAAMSIPGAVAVTSDHVANVGELKIVFSGSPTAATVLVAARNWSGMGQR